MKRSILCLLLIACLCFLPSCDAIANFILNQIPKITNDQTYYKTETTVPDNVLSVVSKAYGDAFSGTGNTVIDPKPMDYLRYEGGICMNYHGRIGDAHIVSLNRRCPDKPSMERAEAMEFRYYPIATYLVYDETLYTPVEAYNENIVDHDNLCLLFGITSCGLDTFRKTDYDLFKSRMLADHPGESELYEVERYYGKYNGYTAVSCNYRGGQWCLAFSEGRYNLEFEYGYESSRILFMNENETLTIQSAVDKNAISREDLIRIFTLHTGHEMPGAKLDEALLDNLVSAVREYLDEHCQLDENFKNDYVYITKYYGKYGDSYVFATSVGHLSLIEVDSSTLSEEELDLIRAIMGHSGSVCPCVYNNGQFYTLDQAIANGIITYDMKYQTKQ